MIQTIYSTERKGSLGILKPSLFDRIWRKVCKGNCSFPSMTVILMIDLLILNVSTFTVNHQLLVHSPLLMVLSMLLAFVPICSVLCQLQKSEEVYYVWFSTSNAVINLHDHMGIAPCAWVCNKVKKFCYFTFWWDSKFYNLQYTYLKI